MELTPQAVVGAQFSSVRKGYDPDEVRAFLATVARGIESIQNAAGAADARAKAAEAEVTRQREESLMAPPPAAATTATVSTADDTEQISRVLLLAQRTADAAVSEAEQEARSIVDAAEEKARTAVADAESRAAGLVAAARAEAVETGEVERSRMAAEVAALERRRAEMSADVDRLSADMAAGRERLIAVVESLQSILEQPVANRRGPSGVAPARAPLDAPRLTFEHPAPPELTPAPTEDDPPPPAAAAANESPPDAEMDAPDPQPPLRAVEDDITGEFEPVTPATRDELRDALADRFFDQGTFEDERWKPKA